MLLCKDKNFKANHNTYRSKKPLSEDVCYSAKIRILKQITTCLQISMQIPRCLLLCKDKNFKANHNNCLLMLFSDMDVCYSAKIRILKQITTRGQSLYRCAGCLLLCKDKNFKANHNTPVSLLLSASDVCYSAKIRILKQITTIPHDGSADLRMFVTLQR